MALPKGYEELHYVIVPNGAYLNLGTSFGSAGAGNTTISITYYSTSSTGCLSGCNQKGEKVNTSYYEYFVGGRNGTFYYRDDDDQYSWSGAFVANQIQTVELDPANYIKIDGTNHNLSDAYGWGTLYILYSPYFNCASNPSYFDGNVYTITVSGHLFTPAVRKSDGSVGFYCDNGNFYPSSGTAQFEAGPPIITSTIHIGDKLIKKVFLGSTEIADVYYGEHKLL